MNRKPGRPTCPCNPQTPYNLCCQPYHLGSPAPTALALMQSRYSAFVLGLEHYLLQTWHPSTRPAELDLSSEPMPQWIGLQVIHHEQSSPTHATVEFIARYKLNGKAGRVLEDRLHEVSQFVFEENRWYYRDGEIL